ncbi:MAG TPA: hypothetical protein VF263_05700 [Longimicrobiaceae bacterium]
MNIQEFRRILTAFADSPADVDLGKGRLLMQLRDEVVEASIGQRDGTLWITESEVSQSAFRWIINRVARLPLLAERILSYVSDTDNFVVPSGQLLDQPELPASDEQTHVTDTVSCIRDILDRKIGGASTVLYLTSDAGEGKTTLINHTARTQASAYKRKESDWLLVPISLGGRPFLRFDDVVIGALVNRLRFQFFYYDAFIELIRMGALVPAFDGFEEMFIESSSGEALSALGGLMNTLNSSGTVVISARKAYFEYKSFATQARLFDAVGSDAVSFARLALERWSRDHFIHYAQLRKVKNPENLYDTVATRLTPSHPVLTRAVLVRRLIDVATSPEGVNELISDLGTTPQDYFYQFVNAIIEREANEKWIDRSGDPARPLLSTQEHHHLLSMVAHEMWISSTDSLTGEVLDLVAEMFSELHDKSPTIVRQIKERIKQHSLITSSDSIRGQFAFDHEDFRKFFLGESLGRALSDRAEYDLRSILQVGTLPEETSDAGVAFVRRNDGPVPDVSAILLNINKQELPTSYTKENCGALIIRLLDGYVGLTVEVRGVNFPSEALRGRTLRGICFENCLFQGTSLDGTELWNCVFSDCSFDRLEFGSTTHLEKVKLRNSDVVSLINFDTEERYFDPVAILNHLQAGGFLLYDAEAHAMPAIDQEVDQRIVLTERALRLFLRGTQQNELTLRSRLGVRANEFFEDVLPSLLDQKILEEVRYDGGGRQRRFKISTPMQLLDRAVRESKGDFEQFLQRARLHH